MRVVVHVGLNEVGDIVAGAHKSAWPVFQLIQESVQFFVIGEDINAPGEAVFRPDDELMPVHAVAVAKIALLVGHRIVDIPQKTDLGVAVLYQQVRDPGLCAETFDQSQVAIQLGVCQGRDRVKEYFGQGKVVHHTQDLRIIYVQDDNAVDAAVQEDRRKTEAFRVDRWHISIQQVYIVIGKLLRHAVDDIGPKECRVRP